MASNSWRRAMALLAVIGSTLSLQGCATLIKPSSLAVPSKVTCLTVPAGTEANEVRGLLKIKWITRLQAAPYVAERMDDKGTYFRGPPGAVYITTAGAEDKPAGILTHMNYDGGIYVPKDPAQAPHLYLYNSAMSVPAVAPPADATCANTTYARETNAKGVSALNFALGGAVGGAVGGAAGRAASSSNRMSYGQAAGAGAAGGAIGGLIIAGLINMDVGKIFQQPAAKDPAFVAALRAIASHPQDVQEAGAGSASGAGAAAAAAAVAAPAPAPLDTAALVPAASPAH